MPTDTIANTDEPTLDATTADIAEAMEARDTRNREARLRRKLAKNFHRLEKTRPTHGSRAFYGVGYQIVNSSNVVVAGCGSREFEMTLEQAEEFAADLAEEHA